MTPILAIQPVVSPITGPLGFADTFSSPGGRWVIEPIVEPDGERGYIIMPASGDDADGPTFAVWQVGSSFRIDETRWDTYRTVAECLTSEDVLAEIEQRTGVQNWAHIS